MLARTASWSFGLCAVALAAFYLVASFHLFPAQGIDSAPHLVPVLNLASGHGFGDVVWKLTRDYDPTGQHRFLQYPPLFHLLVAGLIPRATVANVYLCLAGFAVAALWLYAALILQKRTAGGPPPDPLWMPLACLSLCAVSTWLYSLPSAGRPEALATPLILLGTLCTLCTRTAFRPVTAGIFIGLLGATQIATACLSGLLFSVYASLEPGARAAPFKRWLAQVSLAGAISLLAFVSCFGFSPYPFMETMHGIAFHLSQMPVGEFSIAAYFVFPAPSSTFYGPFFAVLLVHFLWWHRKQLGWLGMLNVGGFVVLAWSLGIRHPNRCYNILSFAPVLIALAMHLVAGLDREDGSLAAHRRRGLVYALYFGLFALMSLGIVRQAVLFNVVRKQGVSYQEAQKHLRELLPPGSEMPVLFDSGLWPLLDGFDHAYQRCSEDLSALDAVPGPEKPVVIIHQWYGRLAQPPVIPGYQLIWNDFIAQPPPRVLGIRIGSAMPAMPLRFTSLCQPGSRRSTRVFEILPTGSPAQYHTSAQSSSSSP